MTQLPTQTPHQSKELGYSQKVALAVMRLKHRLQRKYEQAYPRLCDIIPVIVEQEEKNAWELSLFPHLLLPGLIEGRIGQLTCASVGESTQTRRKFAGRCLSTQMNVKRVRIPRLQGLLATQTATTWQATQEPPSHKATARQTNKLRFGPASAAKFNS